LTGSPRVAKGRGMPRPFAFTTPNHGRRPCAFGKITLFTLQPSAADQPVQEHAMTTDNRRKYSAEVVDGISKAPGRAMLRAVGFTDEDFRKPQIGIASTWSNVTPCNMHINGLAEEAARGADAAGGKGVIFNTITISDGIANGTEGMKYSLVSREIIADSIEAVAGCGRSEEHTSEL